MIKPGDHITENPEFIWGQQCMIIAHALERDDPWRVRDSFKYMRYIYSGRPDMQEKVFLFGVGILPEMLRATHKGAARVFAADLLGRTDLPPTGESLHLLFGRMIERKNGSTMNRILEAMTILGETPRPPLRVIAGGRQAQTL